MNKNPPDLGNLLMGIKFMPIIKNFLLLPMISYRQGIILLLVFGLASCSSLPIPSLKAGSLNIGSNVTQIAEIKPDTDEQTTVYIQGKVERQVPLLERWAYQINDSTGKIWVISRQSDLNEGDHVVFKGKVRYKSIPLADQEFGEVYIEES
jgi:hypothetical protein